MESIEITINDTPCRFDFDWEVLLKNQLTVYVRNVSGVLYPYLPESFFIAGIIEKQGDKWGTDLNVYNYVIEGNVDPRATIDIIRRAIGKAIIQHMPAHRPAVTLGGILVSGEVEEKIIITKQKTLPHN